MAEKRIDEREAEQAVSGLQQGLDSAKQLVERTRSLLTGGTIGDPGGPAISAAQAASLSDSVQNPAAE